MPSFPVDTGRASYEVIVERGVLKHCGSRLPPVKGEVFVVTNEEIWRLHGDALRGGLGDRRFHTLFSAPGEEQKRMASVEALAERMVALGGDRSSLVIAFGGGIVNDLGGFLAAVFMRGIPVVQVPTTLLAQVDAAVGGKTGANLVAGKNLVGAFHQPASVWIDPEVLETLPEREYRAGLYEVIKHGVIASPALFDLLEARPGDVLRRAPDAVDMMVAESVRIKSEVVSADEKEGDLRRILNFGHTIGHALEAETKYERFLHGEAVAFGMNAATRLAGLLGLLDDAARARILRVVAAYGPIPALKGIAAQNLVARLKSDKKTVQGKVHFVLPDRVGHVVIRSGIDEATILRATEAALS